ncbi:MAG: DMT family transporter [Promethearchaeota archaeon]
MGLQKKTYILLMFVSLIFGTNYVFTKQVVPPLNGLSFLYLRSVIGAIFLVSILVLKGKGKELAKFFRAGADGGPSPARETFLTSVVFYAGSNVVTFLGTPFTTATNQVIEANFSVAVIVVLNFAITRESPGRRVLQAAVLSTLGVFFVIAPLSPSNPMLLGDSLTLVGVVLGSYFAIKMNGLAEKYGPLVLTLSLSLLPAIVLTPVVVFTGMLSPLRELTRFQWVLLIWLGVGISGIGYSLVSEVYRDPEITPEKMGVSSSLIPVVGILYGVLVFHEPFTWLKGVGAFLVVFSVYWAQSVPRTKERHEIPQQALPVLPGGRV